MAIPSVLTTTSLIGSLILFLVTGAPAAAAETAGQADGRPGILVMGDSISAAYGIQRNQGWVDLLTRRIDQLGLDWQVVNASVSGETTGGGLARLPRALETHDPGLVIIELGGNDGLRGYPVDRIRANLRAMVELAAAGGRQVLLVGMQIPPNYGPRYARSFTDMYREVADATGVALVPFLLEDVALVPELMQADGIHPTAAAQPTLLDTLWRYLAPMLKT